MFGRKDRSRASEQREARSILQAAREGANHDVWIHQAARKLQVAVGVERCGVWLDTHPVEEPRSAGPSVFRGEVFEVADGYGSGEWTLLSPASPLPLEILAAGKTAEFHLPENSHRLIAGPAMGMRHGLWVPVLAGKTLRGIVLAACGDEETPLPRRAAEEIAEELGFALEWQERNRLEERDKADLELSARVHAQIAAEADGQRLLQEIAESCSSREGPEGIGAVFTLIGGLAVQAPSSATAEERLEIRAHSGESAWAHSVEKGPLEMFWRRAIETGETVAAEPTALPLARDIARIVSFPLIYEGTVHGTLLAGLPHGRAQSENMERLERRAPFLPRTAR